MKHEHLWEMERPCHGQVVLKCTCGVEIWVCPMGANGIAVENPKTGNTRYFPIPKGEEG